MYLEYFGLLETPFSIAPDPRYLYMSERHREALAHLLYGIESTGAFILLTGDVGTGKTTVSRCLLEQVPEDTYLALVLNPKLNAIELLQVICDEFRITYDKSDLSAKALVDYINRYLLGAHALGKKTVLLIEEAQNLDLDVLEQLRLLTNLETSERKLLQVILLGQPEFLEVLDRPELSQLSQRITARFHLSPLMLHEVEEYVSYRLSIAGCRRPLFGQGVIKLLYRYSGGVPRLINVICDRALLGCYVQNHHYIDKKTLTIAAKEVLGENKAALIKPKYTQYFYQAAAFSVIVILLVFVTVFLINNEEWFLEVEQNVDGIEKQVPQQIEDKIKEESDDKINKPLVKLPKDNSNEQTAIAYDALRNNTRVQVGQIESEQTLSVKPIPQPIKPEFETKAVTVKTIKWPDSDQRLRSNIMSYQALFDRWELSYNNIKHGTPCFFARTQGLACRHEASGLKSLREFNRPAVLTLLDEYNKTQYVTIIALNDKEATLIIAGEEQAVSLVQLALYWKGDFSFFWSTPDGYFDPIMPGDSGKVILWLSRRMHEINRNSGINRHSYYDNVLVDQVKAFQVSEGLVGDGIVGIKTLIHINQATSQQVPLLESS